MMRSQMFMRIGILTMFILFIMCAVTLLELIYSDNSANYLTLQNLLDISNKFNCAVLL